MSIIRCEKHDRNWDSDFKEECPLCEIESPISKAIEGRNLLSFSFSGRSYIVEPHAYGETSSGKEVLRCFQVGGDNQAFGWHLISVTEATGLEVLAQHFNGHRTGYALGDRGMSKIYDQLALSARGTRTDD